MGTVYGRQSTVVVCAFFSFADAVAHYESVIKIVTWWYLHRSTGEADAPDVMATMLLVISSARSFGSLIETCDKAQVLPVCEMIRRQGDRVAAKICDRCKKVFRGKRVLCTCEIDAKMFGSASCPSLSTVETWMNVLQTFVSEPAADSMPVDHSCRVTVDIMRKEI